MEIIKKKCPDCGKTMDFIRKLTSEEKNDVDYVNSLYATTNKDMIDVTSLNEEQLLAYFEAKHKIIAKADYLREIFFRKLFRKEGNTSLRVYDSKIYLHK